MTDIQAYGANPGTTAITQTDENFIWNGRELQNEYAMLAITSGAADAGNTPTTSLRPGLLMGKITSGDRLTQFDDTAVDGSELAYAPLMIGHSVLDSTGTAAHRNAHVLLKGILHAANIINLDAYSRRQLLQSGRYIFDDDITSKHNSGGLPNRERIITVGTLTVVAADVGTLWIIGATCAVTLPTLAAGLGPFEFLVNVDAEVTIASAAGNDIIGFNDLLASTVTITTASEHIGARLQFCANAAGNRWLIRDFSCTSDISQIAWT